MNCEEAFFTERLRADINIHFRSKSNIAKDELKR